MSRIEEALEKAEFLRTGPAPVMSAASNLNKKHIPPIAPTAALKVTNELLVSASDPHTPAAEEYRKLKSVIVKLTKGDCFLNMLMVTSALCNEGKSVTALNLALSMAHEYDHTVMLVDADLRKPSVHEYLGLGEKAGLSECLLDGLDIKDALINTGIGKLSLLPAGRPIRNPSEIFSSQGFKDFFLEMKNRYHDRYIIIDAPPILPFAEGRSLSAIVDGVVLVAKEGLVTLDNISETLECLKGANMLGVVYNGATQDIHGAGLQYYRHDFV